MDLLHNDTVTQVFSRDLEQLFNAASAIWRIQRHYMLMVEYKHPLMIIEIP